MLSGVPTFLSAANLDNQAKEFFETQTGHHLKAMFPRLSKPEEITKAAIDRVATKYKINGFDYAHKQLEIDKIYHVIEPLLQREIDTRNTHSVFYHGHSNEMSLYMDILKEFFGINNLKDSDNTHPLRLKNANSVKNVETFLDNFTKEYEKAQKQKGKKPYNPKRNSGFTSAPDLSDYARKHTICVNPSLFGNIETSFECTFYYFLNSFNIGNPNEALIKNLLVSTGLASDDPTELQTQLDTYKNLFTQKLKASGGGLMQILVRKDKVDQVGYASWAKGVPFYTDKKTGKFATRNHNKRAISILANETSRYKRPKLSSVLDLYKKNSFRFAKKYSFNNKSSFYSYDRLQARLIINPKVFSDSKKVQIFRTFRADIDQAELSQYNANIKTQIEADLITAVSKKKLTPQYFDYKFAFGSLVNYVFGKSQVKLSHVMELVKKSTQTACKKAIDLIEQAAHKITKQSKLKKIFEKINILRVVDSIRDALNKVGGFAKMQLAKYIKYLASH